LKINQKTDKTDLRDCSETFQFQTRKILSQLQSETTVADKSKGLDSLHWIFTCYASDSFSDKE